MASQQDLPQPSSSSHRLPTISASQALQSLKSSLPRSISTGLDRLDVLLQGPAARQNEHHSKGGLLRGQVTEVYGPPGVGKTTIGMQVSANALSSNERVIWIECGSKFARPRMDSILAAAKARRNVSSSAPTTPGSREGHDFSLYSAPTLAHLQALFLHPPPSFPPPRTALIVIDSVSTPIDDAFSRGIDSQRSGISNQVGRSKYTVIHSLSSALTKLAALNHVAILLTSHAVTKIHSGKGAVLVPATNSPAWDGGISTRLVLFRDWPVITETRTGSTAEQYRAVRFIGVSKLNGLSLSEDPDPGTILPFTIDKFGISEVHLGNTQNPAHLSSSPIRGVKRKYDEEVPDSEADSDEFEWDGFDDLATEGLIDEAELIRSSKIINEPVVKSDG